MAVLRPGASLALTPLDLAVDLGIGVVLFVVVVVVAAVLMALLQAVLPTQGVQETAATDPSEAQVAPPEPGDEVERPPGEEVGTGA